MQTYLSKEGLDKLISELENRKSSLRREIADRISNAKELGDLSENFEYQEAKEAQGTNEMRILELEEMLKDVVVVESQSGADVIQLGVRFSVQAQTQSERAFEMVGSTEADPISGKISNESPLGRSFVGAKIGDVVVVETPAGTVEYTVTRIE